MFYKSLGFYYKPLKSSKYDWTSSKLMNKFLLAYIRIHAVLSMVSMTQTWIYHLQIGNNLCQH